MVTQPMQFSLAWGEWLSRWEWSAWCTLTFRDPGYTHEAATRSWLRFASWIRREGSPDLAWFVGHEVGARGRLHLHALLGAVLPYTQRSALWSWWHKKYGRAQILAYHPKLGAAHYVSKYVTKDLAHYDLDLRGLDQCCSAQLSHPLQPGTPNWKRKRGESD